MEFIKICGGTTVFFYFFAFKETLSSERKHGVPVIARERKRVSTVRDADKHGESTGRDNIL